MQLEMAQAQLEQVESTKQMNRAMGGIQKEIGGADAVDDAMSQMQEHQDDLQDITDILSGPVGEDVDMDELEAELEELDAEVMEDELLETPGAAAAVGPASVGMGDDVSLPVAPSGEI